MCYCANTPVTTMMKGKKEAYYYNNNNNDYTTQEHGQLLRPANDELMNIIQGIDILNTTATTARLSIRSVISSLTDVDDDGDDDSLSSSNESTFDDDAYHERGIIDDLIVDDHVDDHQGMMIHRRIKCSSIVLSSLKPSAQGCDSATRTERPTPCKSRSFLTTIYLNTVLDDCCEDLSSKIIHIHSKEHNHSHKECVHNIDGVVANNDNNKLSKKGDGTMTRKLALSKLSLPLKQVVQLSSQEEEEVKYKNVTEKLKSRSRPASTIVSQNNSNHNSTRLQLIKAMELLSKDHNNNNKKEQQDDMTKKNDKKQMHCTTSKMLLKKEESSISTNAAIAKRRESSLRKLFMIPHNKKSSLSDLFQNKTSRAA